MALTKVSRNLLNTSIVDNGTNTAITIASDGSVSFSSTISATGYNNSNWDTAYSWGDHSTQSYATQSYVNTQVANLVDSAPSTLDTLNELASALGDDANFSTTVTNSISGKLDSSAYTAADVLTKIKTVDGSGSGLDADNLDGYSWSATGKEIGANNYNVIATHGAGLRFWNGSNDYRIYMASSGTSGAGRVSGETTSDYNMYFRMTGGTNRGFVFQNSTSNKAGIDASGHIRTVGNVDCNYLRADRIYSNNDGSSGYFYNDSGTRTAYTGGDFYIMSGVSNCYIYATNTYLGSTSGDTIRFRGNTVTHNGWQSDSSGHFRMNDNKYFRLGSGSDVEHFWNGSNYYTDINGGANWYIRDGNTYNNVEFMLDIDNGHFHADGNIYAYSTSTNSDIKLKENIATIENPFEVLNSIKGCSWTWKKDGSEGAGVIAQEVEKVMPSAVSDVKELNSEDTVKTVEYNQLIGVLIEAVKELKAEVEELKGGK